MLTFAVYLQLCHEYYDSVKFLLKLLPRIATFHHYSSHFIILYCISLDTYVTTDPNLWDNDKRKV